MEDIALRRPTLDEVFLALTGRTTSDTNNANDTNDIDPTSPKEGAAA